MEWDTVIGLEVHAQLNTKSKLFSGSATTFGALPNSQTSFIDAGLPGVLPVLNQEAVTMAIQFGLAIDATINNLSYFERKNYFYPDLPKGYQISQFQRPIVANGSLTIETLDNHLKQVIIDRAHLEEDAGKSLHETHPDFTGIDLNRAGTPLLEIVTAPCLYSANEVIAYLKSLQQLVRFIGICDGNMQEGSFRCDVNISLKPAGATTLGTRAELKNLNSFKFIEKAITFEQVRQQDLLETGQRVTQETRSFCPDTGTTQVLRSKENEQDYRYFPDPDLLPIEITLDEIERIRKNLRPLPTHIKQELQNNPLLHNDDIHFILSSPAIYAFFCAVKNNTLADEKTIINWLKGNYIAKLNEDMITIENPPVSAESLGKLLTHLSQKTLSNAMAKEIFNKLWQQEGNVDEIIKKEGLTQIQDSDLLENIIQQLITQYPEQVSDFRAGKEKLLAFFVGQVMKQTRGQANPEVVNGLLKKYLFEVID